MRLKKKVTIITGASNDGYIGQSVARVVAPGGAKLVITAHTQISSRSGHRRYGNAA